MNVQSNKQDEPKLCFAIYNNLRLTVNVGIISKKSKILYLFRQKDT